MFNKNSSTKLYNTLMGNPTANNAIGRTSGAIAASGSNDNFFTKKAKSLENAIGTTLAAPASFFYDNSENIKTGQLRQDNKNRMNDIAKKYGYNTWNDWQDGFQAAKDAGDTAKVSAMQEQLKEFQNEANTNAAATKEKANAYKDYRENNYVSQKINQDRGKFAGSAMNTLSTMADVGLMAAGVPTGALFNAGQGALEGIADELEQNGEQNFSWDRARQNALVGAASGAVTGALNKGLSNSLAQKGGKIFTGGNKLTQGINNFNSKGVGKVLSTVGSGAARGALSGAVGGATGAGVSSALQGADIGTGIANSLQGAVQGAKQGALTGGTMAGANMAFDATLNKVAPNIANSIRENQMRNASYGDTLRDQFKGAWNSGDSRVAEFAKSLPDKFSTTATTTTPAQDAYVAGQGSFSDALNEFIEQGGNIGRDEKGNLTLVEPNATNNMSLTDQAENILAKYDALGDEIPTNPPAYGEYNTQRANAISELRNNFSDNDLAFLFTETDNPKIKALISDSVTSPDIKNRLADYEAQGPTYQTTTNANQPTSQWDNLAQESGYATYDDAIRAFTKANPNAEVDAGAVLTWLDNNPGEWNPNSPRPTVEQQEVPTSKQIKAKREIVEDITNQFNPVDQPTARSTKPNETFYKIYDEWGLSDGDDIRQAVSYAEPGALVPQMIREAAGEAGVIDLSDAEGLIVDLKINKKNYDKYVNALEDIMDSTDTTIIGGKQGVDALELQRTLERMASDARGTNGTYHIGNTVVDETMARNFQRIANEIGDKLDEAAVSKGVVQNVLNRHSDDIQQMRNAFQNDTWQSAVDNKISGAKTIRDLRSSIKDLTRANIFINNGDERYSTFGGRFAAKSSTIPTSKSGIANRLINEAYDKAKNSSIARNARLEKNAKIVRGETATTPKLAVTNTPTTTPTYYTPATQLYNAIGRTEGLNNAEQARTAGYLANAVQNVPKAPNAGTVTLEDLTTPTSTGTTSVYNSLYGTESTSPSNSGYFQATGDYWTDTLGKAMSAAIDADDVEAFGALYGMYQDALANLQKTNSSETKLTDKQRQANAAALALDNFEATEPNAAYDVSDIPIIGAIANIGGNEYASKAEALALQLGYMLSGATVNREEAKNIGMAYVPQPRDNAAVRQSKLNQIRGIISEYQKTYAD